MNHALAPSLLSRCHRLISSPSADDRANYRSDFQLGIGTIMNERANECSGGTDWVNHFPVQWLAC